MLFQTRLFAICRGIKYILKYNFHHLSTNILCVLRLGYKHVTRGVQNRDIKTYIMKSPSINNLQLPNSKEIECWSIVD